jgi:hypothetical protein
VIAAAETRAGGTQRHRGPGSRPSGKYSSRRATEISSYDPNSDSAATTQASDSATAVIGERLPGHFARLDQRGGRSDASKEYGDPHGVRAAHDDQGECHGEGADGEASLPTHASL